MTTLTSDLDAIRDGMRAWLRVHAPAALPSDEDARFEALRDWQRALYDAGWLGLGFPSEYGGHGGDPFAQIVFYQELARAKAPFPATLVGLDVIVPTLLEQGTEEQKKRFVKPLLSGEEIWCQGFSEPGAGSDLAALATRADLDGDAFHVNGQKIWTTTVQYSDWCALLARTEPGAPKHKGISYLLVDMRSPGITARPIEQINGDKDFGEIFFDDVRVPLTSMLGNRGDGWRLALATLVHERSVYTLRRQAELRAALDELAAEAQLATRDGVPLLEDAGIRRRFGRCEALVETMAAQGFRTAWRMQSGSLPSESSVDKLLLSHVEQEVFGLALDLLGEYAVVTESDGLDRSRWFHDYLYGRASSIYGGTAEIQRSIIAEQLLGLLRA